jgi:hypothetical protein
MKKIMGLFLVSTVLLSCNGYYKAITVKDPTDADRINTLAMKNRYFILHTDSTAFVMEDISLIENNAIKCYLDILPGIHSLHVNNSNPKMKYSVGGGEYDESGVVNEIHFYMAAGGDYKIGSNQIPLQKITGIDILERDKQKMRRQKLVGWGIGVGSVVVVAGLIINSSVQNWKWK